MSLHHSAAAAQLAALSLACNACATKKKRKRTPPLFSRRHALPASPRTAGRTPGEDHMKFKHMLGLLSAVAMSLALTGGAVAQQTVKIGAIFPFSGNAASAGNHAKAAIEVAMDIINNDHPELGDFPLAKGAGLPGLGGAKVEVVFADNQGSPATGQNQ